MVSSLTQQMAEIRPQSHEPVILINIFCISIAKGNQGLEGIHQDHEKRATTLAKS